jgi:hypothetical protein
MSVPKEYFINWLEEDYKLIEVGDFKPLFYVSYVYDLKTLWIYDLKNVGEVKGYIKEMTTPRICEK